jgi:hypothetical protein
MDPSTDIRCNDGLFACQQLDNPSRKLAASFQRDLQEPDVGSVLCLIDNLAASECDRSHHGFVAVEKSIQEMTELRREALHFAYFIDDNQAARRAIEIDVAQELIEPLHIHTVFADMMLRPNVDVR